MGDWIAPSCFSEQVNYRQNWQTEYIEPVSIDTGKEPRTVAFGCIATCALRAFARAYIGRDFFVLQVGANGQGGQFAACSSKLGSEQAITGNQLMAFPTHGEQSLGVLVGIGRLSKDLMAVIDDLVRTEHEMLREKTGDRVCFKLSTQYSELCWV